ncbi:ATP synthase subunit I [Brachymonas sp.]|uniref:ATP synthase subunit I n=1 Tax=unclassified Brachymonas TaxID=2621329 RepID=UPI0035ADC6F2
MSGPEHKSTALVDDEPSQETFVPLSAEEAQAWRAAHPQPSLWRIWRSQVAMGICACVLALLLRQALSWPWAVPVSVAYGVLAVLVPGGLATAGMWRASQRMQGVSKVAGAGFGFAVILLWEGFKVLLTIAMLVMAPRVLHGWINWLALVAGFVVTLKTYWWAWMRSQARRHQR